MWPLIAAPAQNALTRRVRERFHWSSDDLSLDARSGHPGTLVRASSGTITDRWGNVLTVGTNVPRWSIVPGSFGANNPQLALVLERAATNKVIRSNDLANSAWVASGTPIRTANAKVYGDLSLTRLEDNSTGAVEYVYDAVTEGATYATLSAYVSRGTNPAASGTTLRVRSTTGPTTRGGVLLQWNDDVPYVTSLSGADVGIVQVGPDLWRIWAIIATGIVTTQTNQVEVHPVTTSSQVGDVYIGGVQYEDGRAPTSLIITNGSTASRSADQLTWDVSAGVGALAWPDAFTALLECARPPEYGYAGAVDVAGGVTLYGNARIARDTTARNWIAYPTTTMSGGASDAWRADDPQRVVAQFAGYRAGGRRARIDVGDGFTGWTSETAGVVAPGSTIAAYADSTNASDLWLRRLVVLAGGHDYDDLRRYW